jgi:hypothetical protein
MAEHAVSPRTLWMHAVSVSHLPAPARHIALVIGTYMDQNAKNSHPSLRTIEKDSGLSYQTVNTHLRSLEFIGLLEIDHGSRGSGHVNRYWGRIPPFIAKRMEERSKGWTIPREIGLTEYGKGLADSTKRSSSLTGSTPDVPLLKGASRSERERQDPDPIHYADNAWCRCQICLDRHGVTADAS